MVFLEICSSKLFKDCRKKSVKAFGCYFIIFVLFTFNVFMGALTLVRIYGTLPLEPGEAKVSSILNYYVPADSYGPGLDGRRDEAMFIYLEMNLPEPFHVVVFDDESTVPIKSAGTNQIINRLYIGQLQELSHLEDGTLTKAVPCSRAFPFIDRIDETHFTWNSYRPTGNTDLSSCKLIFTFSYVSGIRIEWGIRINDENICPTSLRPFDMDEVLTTQVENDIINYTCNSACGDDANICNNSHNTAFRSFSLGQNLDEVSILSDLYFAINDLKEPDTCSFTTTFERSSKFCDGSWPDVEPVEIPEEIRDVYPQFITIPELYRGDDENNKVPRNYCNQLWNSSMVCC